jgi:hypothetical protein
MRNNFLIGGIFFVILLAASKLGTKDTNSKSLYEAFLAKYGKTKAEKFQIIYNTLKKFNLSPTLIRYIIAQVMQETGIISSTQSLTNYNNYSGITYSGSAGQKATGAYRSPAIQPENRKNNYAAYPEITNWAKDHLRIISFSPNYPIKATSITDYARRLKANGYYGGSETVYANNMKKFNDFLITQAKI